MVICHDNYKWSPGQQLCARMTKVDNYVPERGKFGQFFVIFVVFGSCSSSGMGEVWAVFCHLCCLRFLQQQWNGGSLGSFCHLCCLWFLQQQQKMPSGALCLCLRALQEYGDDGIGHDDVKDFFNDAYAHKTLLITLCR